MLWLQCYFYTCTNNWTFVFNDNFWKQIVIYAQCNITNKLFYHTIDTWTIYWMEVHWYGRESLKWAWQSALISHISTALISARIEPKIEKLTKHENSIVSVLNVFSAGSRCACSFMDQYPERFLQTIHSIQQTCSFCSYEVYIVTGILSQVARIITRPNSHIVCVYQALSFTSNTLWQIQYHPTTR